MRLRKLLGRYSFWREETCNHMQLRRCTYNKFAHDTYSNDFGRADLEAKISQACKLLFSLRVSSLCFLIKQ